MLNIAISKFAILLYFISLTTTNFVKLETIHQTFAAMCLRFLDKSQENDQLCSRKRNKKNNHVLMPYLTLRANSHRSPKA